MVKAGENGKLVFSPVWDMDLAFGAIIDRFEVNTITPDIWWANSMSYPDPTVLTAAYRHDDFREAVRTRWAQMLEEMRPEYDYIFLDCPPVEIVTDADIIGSNVDMTIFVVRAGLLERSMLPEIDRYYKTQKYKNMALLLNGTDGSGRYGYKYGYKYGYRYGSNGAYGSDGKEDE